jgi:hypothetical protein
MCCRFEENRTNSYSCCISPSTSYRETTVIKARREHQHIYAPARNQKGNQSRGAWRPTNTTGRHQAREPIPWKHRHNAKQDQGGKETIGHHVHLPLGWMDGHTWYQLATLLSRSYCMVSSRVSRMKHVKGDGM